MRRDMRVDRNTPPSGGRRRAPRVQESAGRHGKIPVYEQKVEILDVEIGQCLLKHLVAPRIVAFPDVMCLEQFRNDEEVFSLDGPCLRHGAQARWANACDEGSAGETGQCTYEMEVWGEALQQRAFPLYTPLQ
jgi:hypothetical protein